MTMSSMEVAPEDLANLAARVDNRDQGLRLLPLVLPLLLDDYVLQRRQIMEYSMHNNVTNRVAVVTC